MSRALIRRVEEIERRLMMSEADKAELDTFDWDEQSNKGGRAAVALKYFQVTEARFGLQLEDHVELSWPDCTPEKREAFMQRVAPLTAMIEK